MSRRPRALFPSLEINWERMLKDFIEQGVLRMTHHDYLELEGDRAVWCIGGQAIRSPSKSLGPSWEWHLGMLSHGLGGRITATDLRTAHLISREISKGRVRLVNVWGDEVFTKSQRPAGPDITLTLDRPMLILGKMSRIRSGTGTRGSVNQERGLLKSGHYSIDEVDEWEFEYSGVSGRLYLIEPGTGALSIPRCVVEGHASHLALELARDVKNAVDSNFGDWFLEVDGEARLQGGSKTTVFVSEADLEANDWNYILYRLDTSDKKDVCAGLDGVSVFCSSSVGLEDHDDWASISREEVFRQREVKTHDENNTETFWRIPGTVMRRASRRVTSALKLFQGKVLDMYQLAEISQLNISTVILIMDSLESVKRRDNSSGCYLVNSKECQETGMVFRPVMLSEVLGVNLSLLGGKIVDQSGSRMALIRSDEEISHLVRVIHHGSESCITPDARNDLVNGLRFEFLLSNTLGFGAENLDSYDTEATVTDDMMLV